VIGHLQCLLYQPSRLPDQGGGFCDLRLADALGGVGSVRDLVHIVADSGQFPQQGGVGVGRARLDIYTHNAVPDQGAGIEAG